MAGPDLDWDVVALRQALAEVYEALGDIDQPAHIPAGELRVTVVEEAKRLRNDYERALGQIVEMEEGR